MAAFSEPAAIEGLRDVAMDTTDAQLSTLVVPLASLALSLFLNPEQLDTTAEGARA